MSKLLPRWRFHIFGCWSGLKQNLLMICRQTASTKARASRKNLEKNPRIASRRGKWKTNVAAEMQNSDGLGRFEAELIPQRLQNDSASG